MNQLSPVLLKALELSKPMQGEVKKVSSIAKEVKERISKHTSSSTKIKDVVLGGSYAKGTWLKGDVDIDIFIKMDSSMKEEEFELLGKQIGLESLKEYGPYLRYSDHPYVEAFVDGIRVNIVPCYDVEKWNWRSAADRSPFHTEYITMKLDEEKRDQVRLLKKFLKSLGIYGAEIAKNGFSGYATEVLILKYGSFQSTLEALSHVQEEKVIISTDPIDEESAKKAFKHSIIILDPIDPKRNLGTAISVENFGKFVLAARAFLKEPSIEFFTLKEKGGIAKIFSEIYPNILVVSFDYRERSPDVIWGQLKKSMNAISKQLMLAGFNIIRSKCTTDERTEAAFIFLLESTTLPSYMVKTGPKVLREYDSSKFVSKNNNIARLMWIDNEMRITTLVARKATDAKDYVRFLLNERIDRIGITKGLVPDLENKTQIHTANETKLTHLVETAINELITIEKIFF
jgi:tRNA nucleotidyltransferase (CCA-adding enzyme)